MKVLGKYAYISNCYFNLIYRDVYKFAAFLYALYSWQNITHIFIYIKFFVQI